jgi:hypothetical protein
MSLPTGPKDGGFPDPKFLDCLSKECQTARAATVNTANEIILKCSEIAAASAKASAFLAIAAAIAGFAGTIISYLISTVGFAAAITILVKVIISLNWFLIWLAISLIATALVFLTLYAIAMIQVAVLQANLGALQNKFNSEVRDVMKSCPPSCWGDLRIPGC